VWRVLLRIICILKIDLMEPLKYFNLSKRVKKRLLKLRIILMDDSTILLIKDTEPSKEHIEVTNHNYYQ